MVPRQTPQTGGRQRYRFPRAARLRRKADFDRLMRQGIRVMDARVTLIGLPNDQDSSRLGLAVGRKHGGAVRRNRLKRLLREAFRLERPTLPVGLDLVCLPRAGVPLTRDSCRASLAALTRRLAKRFNLGPGHQQQSESPRL